jgi:hypothetical protein
VELSWRSLQRGVQVVVGAYNAARQFRRLLAFVGPAGHTCVFELVAAGSAEFGFFELCGPSIGQRQGQNENPATGLIRSAAASE